MGRCLHSRSSGAVPEHFKQAHMLLSGSRGQHSQAAGFLRLGQLINKDDYVCGFGIPQNQRRNKIHPRGGLSSDK